MAFEVAQIFDAEEQILFDSVFCPTGYWLRLRGLIGRRQPRSEEAWWIADCRSIHTMWMRYSIDVVFLDATGTVVATRCALKPWRVATSRSARTVVEVRSGAIEAHRILIGQRLEIRACAR